MQLYNKTARAALARMRNQYNTVRTMAAPPHHHHQTHTWNPEPESEFETLAQTPTRNPHADSECGAQILNLEPGTYMRNTEFGGRAWGEGGGRLNPDSETEFGSRTRASNSDFGFGS